jgi:hypothetical protein
MRKTSNRIVPNDTPMTDVEFLESFNKNMPQGYPRVTLAILKRFKENHLSMFKANGLWSLDQHRKRMIDWLPQNLED